MPGATSDVWEVLSTARTIRRFTDQPVDDATLARCLQAAMWAPSGANAQAYVHSIARSGYATDPDYGNKLNEILHGGTLRAALGARTTVL